MCAAHLGASLLSWPCALRCAVCAQLSRHADGRLYAKAAIELLLRRLGMGMAEVAAMEEVPPELAPLLGVLVIAMFNHASCVAGLGAHQRALADAGGMAVSCQ
jgi:hypothetical protein